MTKKEEYIMIEIFESVRNIDFVGARTYPTAGQAVKMQTAILKELDADRWNDLAQRTNTASFIRMTGREPKDYAEVQAWLKSLSVKSQHPKNKPDTAKVKRVLEYSKKADALTSTF